MKDLLDADNLQSYLDDSYKSKEEELSEALSKSFPELVSIVRIEEKVRLVFNNGSYIDTKLKTKVLKKYLYDIGKL